MSSLDMSLEEIASSRRSNDSRSRGSQRRNRDTEVDDFAVTDRRSGGNRRASGGFAGRQQQQQRSSPYSRRRRDDGDSNDTWTHDLFEADGRSGRASRSERSTASEASARLQISNLHWNVSEKDLLELFGSIGPLKSARIKFDNSGRSDGVAFVEYESVRDATNAISTFDGRSLDEMPMKVAYAPLGRDRSTKTGGIQSRLGPPASGGPISSRLGPRPSESSRPSRGGARQDDKRSTRPRPATHESLDAEMDQYMTGQSSKDETGTMDLDAAGTSGGAPGGRSIVSYADA
ncbi:uncharacterized protein BJ171DRAFT_519301 [Polychytrium aggregatum]|uniref:uncharacterized protein n=1 Tax=Polychytrium aggregatum TaxID=110093 RepID=UPI0022FE100E|nr:uncharacterized protein BJ171DRAFT_519301 [Polychytrium aggregatum]KAI9199250.1 hypothetical protein BJ171DRAFT_519301 [Polychytrium aggregatum]